MKTNNLYDECLLQTYDKHKPDLQCRRALKSVFAFAKTDDFPLYDFELYQIEKTQTQFLFLFTKKSDMEHVRASAPQKTNIVSGLTLLYKIAGRYAVPYHKYENKTVQHCKDAILPVILDTNMKII